MRAIGLALVALVLACRPAGSGTPPLPSPATAGGLHPSPVIATAGAASTPQSQQFMQVTTARGNFDGAGADEVVSISGHDLQGWTISFDLLGGRELNARLEGFLDGCHSVAGGALDQPHILGVGDFTAGGRDEVLVQVWHGASTGFAVIFGIYRESITAATVVDGANACQRVFPFGGAVTHGNGVACTSVAGTPGLQVLQASYNPLLDHDNYEWYRTDYVWRGLDLYLVTVEQAAIRAGDSRLKTAWEVHCPGLPTSPG